MNTHRVRRLSAAVLVVAAVSAMASSAVGASPPDDTTPVDDTSLTAGSGPPVVEAPSAGEVRAAKAGLSWFLLDNVDRPTNVSDPCPALSADAAGWYLGQASLTASERPYGAAIVWDPDVGGGIVSLRCGIDLAASAQPAGSTGWSMDITMLDGQATFAQYAVELGGRDVLITQLPDQRAQLVSTCTGGGTSCTAAVEIDDLVITLRLDGLPGEFGDLIVRDLASRVVREVVANLAAVPEPE